VCSSSAISLPALRVYPAVYFLDVLPAPVSQTKLYRARTAHLSVANSRTGARECFASANTRRALYPLLDAREIRAGCHQIPDCNALRRSKNPDSVPPLCAGGGIYRRKNDGRAGWPRFSFRSTRSSFARCGQGRWNSLRVGLTRDTAGFKRVGSSCFSPQGKGF